VIVTETYGPEDQSTRAEKSKKQERHSEPWEKKDKSREPGRKKRSQREYEEPTGDVDY
jgi:hypothetical protein